jgi:predicted murein hydrolase (TIGR00659 family)
MVWLFVTVGVYFFVRWLCSKINSPFANPLLLSMAIIIPLLLWFNVPYHTYYHNNDLLNHLLGPAVVALAYPLYEQLPAIRQNWKVIITCCFVGSLAAMTSAIGLAVIMGAEEALLASILGKSVTTAISMEIAEQFGGVPAIAAILVLLAGIVGALFAYPIFSALNITHPIAKGLTMGTVSHALGTATCFEKSQQDAAFSSLALVLCGVFTSILAPLVFTVALHSIM